MLYEVITNPLAEVAHAAVDLAELLLAVGVLGVFRAVAFGGRRSQRLHDLAPPWPQPLEFALSYNFV